MKTDYFNRIKMQSIIVVKNFKSVDITNTVKTISRYSLFFRLKLLNSINLFLLRNLSFIHLWQFPTREQVVCVNYCWSDLFKTSFSYPGNILFSGSKKFLFILKRNFLLFSLLQLFLNKPSLVSVNFPNKSTIYTLLRSPHTDKKSREQFRKREFKKLVRVFAHPKFLSFLIKKEFITSKLRSTSFLGIK